jgi:hypothetical protein
MCKVNKTEFEEAYRKFPPSKIKLFFLKYLSIHSITLNNRYVWALIILLVLPLIIEITICAFDLPHSYRVFPNILYAILMPAAATFWTIVLLKKQKRLKNIQDYLGISKEEFKEITDIYFYNRYNSSKDFITFHSKNKK